MKLGLIKIKVRNSVPRHQAGKWRGWQFLLSASLLFLASGSEVSAQPNQWTPGSGKPRKPYNNQNEFVPTKLKEAPDMPYIPRYPNKQEIANVLSWPNAKRGPAWSVTSHVKEAPEEVINFYKGALKQNKWELLNGRNTDKMLSARRGKALFNVMVMQPVLKGYRSQVYMTYKIYGPPGE